MQLEVSVAAGPLTNGLNANYLPRRIKVHREQRVESAPESSYFIVP